jgi:hypothetical protein
MHDGNRGVQLPGKQHREQQAGPGSNQHGEYARR